MGNFACEVSIAKPPLSNHRCYYREEMPPIPMGELVDSPIQRDTTYIKRMEHLAISNYGA